MIDGRAWRILAACLLLGPTPVATQPSGLSTGEQVAWSVVDDVVRIAVTLPNGSAGEGGFGFVVGERDGDLYIATADHVVRADGDLIGSALVTFHSDQGHPRAATLLDLRLPPEQGDLAVLELPVPPHYLPEWPPTASTSDLLPGTRAWRIGKQQRWVPAATPGVFVGLQGTIWLGFDDLDTPPGSSGGPVVTEQEIAGMVITGDVPSGPPSSVLPIETIAIKLKLWQLPWNLSHAATFPETASTFGFDVRCNDIESSNDVQAILRKFGARALTEAPAARIASTDRPVIVRPTVGGDDHLGALPPNTRVRVICMEDRNFAVVKQEQGNRDGVVESQALQQP